MTATHRLAQASAARLREIVLDRAPGAHLGSLRDVAELLGVGIVTVQQAARILEHEGLLVVRRGPNGGYYGARPDAAALERGLAAYLRVHGSRSGEALEMTGLMEEQLVIAAARCDDPGLRETIADLLRRVDDCTTPDARIAFEEAFKEALFRMVDRPLTELLSRVSARYYEAERLPTLFDGEEGGAAWRAARRRILQAILDGDAPLARFEAGRHRDDVMRRLEAASA